ncbi:uncharacterized protein C22orf15-like [Styela clava]|uniref:uncharacterized protein CXorf65 homolog n=1 Tax=Styela clava TaxID=7725 RepID=UPI001939D5FD|nr:uncharacterized protein CXorf65 homolog [Styela clava]
MSTQLFISVRYGENRQELFNPHCKSQLLLDCIREKCHCREGEILDLVDENGNVAMISDADNSTEYASQFLEGRKNYVLIRIIKSLSGKEPNRYEALLQNIERHHPDLAERLERMSKPAQLTTAKDKKFQSAKKRGTLSHIKAKSPKRNSVVK